ncbi:hypothetical protein BASA61_005709 [Batrachochytrium salamandrivorans]|nr:hypothetical protein BASA60_008242 [Batrachochytrium salamandrivorans]KAH6572299.1 hypothetical protein BASA62_003448 [Batrachochytrium salamandrivorans]KAH6589146.1 hypothetical protein BASA61_005709 [Batrachochytrium salamandrivorans]KAH9273687.1 hypothetical protein BASA83_004020 [Batrachochytrium salamandrivorans]
MKATVALIYAMATAPMAMAWGMQVHSVIGKVADELLSPGGLRLFRWLLPSTTLADASAWADYAKMTPQYSYTRDFHYIKTRDAPPNQCSFYDGRDCPNGNCLVGAIAEYTSVFQNFQKKSRRELGDALKFLMHFIGDLTQPLHVSGHENGGHSVQVRYGRATVSLHSVIDDNIPWGRIKANFGGNPDRYANYLVGRIKQDRQQNLEARWLSRHSVFDVNEWGNSMAAMEWAVESNALSCAIIWPAYYADPTQDFSAGFYREMLWLVDEQLAKAGFRIAFWINKVADEMERGRR